MQQLGTVLLLGGMLWLPSARAWAATVCRLSRGGSPSLTAGALHTPVPRRSGLAECRGRSGYGGLSTATQCASRRADAPSPAELELAQLRAQTIFTFHTHKYPFRERVQEVLRIPEGQALDVLHEITEWHTEKNGNRISAYQKIWNSDRDRTGRSLSIIEDNPHFEKGREVYARFEEVYRDFIAEVVAPGMGGGKIQYQRAPTIRIMVPASCNTKPSEPTTPLHCDMDYHHQSSELNFWLPLTSVWDTNSLWVESSPGRGDFNAPAMEYGQCSRFYGNQCRHFTKPNLTGKTRVSLDFRAVSSASGGHDPTFRKGRRRGAKARFQDVFDVGGYYEELAVPPVALVMQ